MFMLDSLWYIYVMLRSTFMYEMNFHPDRVDTKLLGKWGSLGVIFILHGSQKTHDATIVIYLSIPYDKN